MAAQNCIYVLAKVLSLQVLIATLIVLGALFLKGSTGALAAGFGGVIALVPNCYFAGKIFLARHFDPGRMLKAFYAAELGKWLITIVLFVSVLQLPGIDFLVLMFGFVVVISAHWLALLLFRD